MTITRSKVANASDTPSSASISPLEPIPGMAGVVLIQRPVTITKLRGAIEEIDGAEDGLHAKAYVGQSESAGGWVIHQLEIYAKSDNKLRIWMVPATGRVTSLVKQRKQEPKSYRSLETLVSQLSELLGEGSGLGLMLNLYKFSDERS